MYFYKLFFNVLYLCFITNVWSILIEENAYTGVAISFSEHIKEPSFKFEKLKQVLRKSSEFLYQASKKRAYFKEFIIILPPQWVGGFCSDRAEEPPEKVNIFISDLPGALQAQNSKGCGQEGDIIYMPLNWTDGNTEDLAIQFVQEWSTYRYGVFEETPLKKDACYLSPNKIWSPVGCYNAKIEASATMSEDDGLSSCKLPDEFVPKEDLKSSLMFKINNTGARHFCNGSESFPHNPVMPTLHNNLCEGKTVWSVIENSNDFKHGKNSPSNFTVPPSPTFKCYKEENIQLTFAVQNSASSDITLVVQELRYSLYRFIRNLVPVKSALNLVTFSDSSDVSESVTLNIEDYDELLETLDSHVVTTKKTNACLLCGIQRALNASQFKTHPSPIVILIAWESALIGQKISELVKTIQNYPKVQLHLIFIEDTETDVLPTDLVNAVRSTGGFLHSLPKPYRTEITDRLVPNVLLFEQLNVILSAAVKSPLEVDDKIIVVHEVTYKTVSSITDTFSTPSVTKGKLVYIMHCDLRGQITREPNCSSWDEEYIATFKCGTVTDLTDEVEPKMWTYKFEVKDGVNNPVCSASAILYKLSSSTNAISLKGWLNQYTITPGQNVLIIYAEISGSYQENTVRVIAQITGPGMNIPTEVELLDNGNGDPDVKSGDGIYSRYFVSYKEKGTYAVGVVVKIAGPANSKNGENYVEPEKTQRKIIGSFSVTAKVPDVDILPPNRVADLKVSQIIHVNSTVTLQWTAPGNDYDFGKASAYEIKATNHPANLMDMYFDSEETVTLKTTQTPQNSGRKEIFQFKFPRNDDDALYYVALRAKDASGNRAKISNTVQVFMKGTKVIIPEVSTGVTVTNNESVTDDVNVTSTEDMHSSTVFLISSTPDTKTDRSWKEILSDTKFIIILSSAGGILLLFILINIIICCCFMRKKKDPKTISKKNSLRPPYNMNIAYNMNLARNQESQSIDQSETDLSVSLRNFTDINQYSTNEGYDVSPRYSYHTSKSIADKTISQSNTELGFKLVDTLPVNTTRSLARFARIFNENGEELNSPVAEPQKPSNSNDNPIVYSLGRV
ncbi:calcium-activated chloride channel regulator 1 isoform X1 [Parasteatoda tepidariorum]|uniref:calcium-activated chloride channel regulator 1 isoform X1 n=1 Tax=Parasteatoda tepidariorum TaxID=114398 RepID=UPI001C717C9D|nr:calcium-activated chloride channel regulator 1 isoform X1 [Parasteatoda tepidariorum]